MDTKTQNIVITILGVILIGCLWFTFNIFGKSTAPEASEEAITYAEGTRDVDLDFDNVDVDMDELRARYGDDIDSVYAAEFPEDEEVDYNKLLDEPETSYAGAAPKQAADRSYTDNMPAFMVIAGAFSSQENAKIFQDQLADKGYTNAEIVRFQSSKYTSICVSRTDDLSTAKAQVEALKKLNIEAYVHTRKITK